MYAWIWRRLPGRSTRDRALAAAGLVAVVTAVLWFLVFPWTESHLRFDDGTVGDATPSPGTSSSTGPRR